MRAETRHQLKQDRFSKVTIEAAGNAAHWTVEHQSKVIAAVIALVVDCGDWIWRVVLHQSAGRKG